MTDNTRNLNDDILHNIGRTLAEQNVDNAMDRIMDVVKEGMGGTFEDAAEAARAYFSAREPKNINHNQSMY